MNILPNVFDFLRAIEQNNNREWFKDNKKQYESAFANVQSFVTELIDRISIFDISVRDLEAKKCFFRLYRDTRFTPNKLPYKTHFGIYIAQGGRKNSSNNAGYYLHIQDNMSMLAGGLWCPETKLLRTIRDEIYYAPEEFVQIIENEEFKSVFGGLIDEDNLKGTPKGYHDNFPYIKLLKYRHYCVEIGFANSEVLAPDFMTKCLKTCKLVFPMVAYLNRAIKT